MLRLRKALNTISSFFLIICLLTTGVLGDEVGNTTPLKSQATTPPVPADTDLQFTSSGHVLSFSSDSYTVASLSHLLKVEFVGANQVKPVSHASAKAEPIVEGLPDIAGSGAKPLGDVVYNNLWPNIDVKYSGNRGGIVESTYTLKPALGFAANVDNIRLRYNRPVTLSEQGELQIAFDNGDMSETKPIAWQLIDGQTHPVEVSYKLLGEQEVGFTLGEYQAGEALLIDPTLSWNAFFGGYGDDVGNAIATDTSGNSYIVGNGGEFGSPVRAYSGGDDIVVTKLNSSGVLQWHTYLGTNANEYGKGIALDGSGNVYVMGSAYGGWNGAVRAYSSVYDILVVKLNSSGVLQWHTFLGASGYDHGQGLAVDNSGNAYVAGYSGTTWGSPVQAYSAGNDIVVAKLNSSGVLQWNTFLGSSGNEYGFGVAIDSSSNVYLTGYGSATWGSPVRAYSAGNDIVVAKLDSSGVLQWNTFLGASGTDQGFAILLDSSANVYVTGVSGTTWGSPVRAYTASSDLVVAKLDSSGVLQWHTFLGGSSSDEGSGISIDSGGNLYVVGKSYGTWGSPLRAFSGSYDILAAKVNSSGALQWHTFLGGSGNDYGNGIALDSSVNMYIAGYSPTTWGSPVNAYTGLNEIVAVQLNSSGVLQWNTFLGGAADDIGYGISVDSIGNSYIVGYSKGPWGSPIRAYSGSDDIVVAKLNSSGVLQWHTFLGGSSLDDGLGIALDSSNNIYVTGISVGPWGSPVRAYTGGYEIFVAQLNSSGVLQWNTFLGGSGTEYGNGIALDSSGNIYVTGYGSGTWGSPVQAYSAGNDIVVAKLNGSGVLQWNTFLGGSGNDYGFGIALDSSANMYITGYSYATWGSPVRAYTGSDDIVVAQLNSSGVLQWNTFLGGSTYDRGYGVAADGSGNVYVTGYSIATWGSPVSAFNTNTYDIAVAKLNSSGVLQWNTFLGGSGAEFGYGIAIDSSSNVYITGYGSATWGSPDRPYTASDDIVAAQLNGSGVLQWNTFLGGSGRDIGRGIALDSYRNVFIAGQSTATWGSPTQLFSGNQDISVASIASGYVPSTPVPTVVALNSHFDLSDSMSRLATSIDSNHSLTMGTLGGVAVGETITLTFDPAGQAFDLGDILYSDIDLADDTGEKTLAAIAAADTWGVAINPVDDTIIFTAPTSGTGYIAENNNIFIKIGLIATNQSNGANQLTNPSSVGAYLVAFDINNDTDEYGDVAIAIVDSDQISIDGAVYSELVFDIDVGITDSVDCAFNSCLTHENGSTAGTYSIDIGELSDLWVNRSNTTAVDHVDGLSGLINSIYLDLTHNIATGVTVYLVSANGALTGDHGSFAPVTDGSDVTVNSETYGFTVSNIAGGTGTINLNTSCSTAGAYCGPSTTQKFLLDTNDTVAELKRVKIDLAAAASSTTPAGNYSDTFTFLVVPGF